MAFREIKNTLDSATIPITVKAGAVTTRSNTRRRTKPLPKRDGSSNDKSTVLSVRTSGSKELPPVRPAAKRAINEATEFTLLAKRPRLDRDNDYSPQSVVGFGEQKEEPEGIVVDGQESVRAAAPKASGLSERSVSSTPTQDIISATAEDPEPHALPTSIPVTASTGQLDIETVEAILNAAIGSASRIVNDSRKKSESDFIEDGGIAPPLSWIQVIVSVTANLSPIMAGDDTLTNESSQPNAVDCADSAIITDEWHGVFPRDHLELDPLLYSKRQRLWERNADPYDVETSSVATTGTEGYRFTTQREAELLTLCKSKQTVAARALIPREEAELVIKSQVGNKEEGAKLVARFLKENKVELAPLKNGKARTEVHVCLMKASIVDGEFSYTEDPCYLAPKRGIGLYATHDDLVRHQREHHLDISRPKEKSRSVAGVSEQANKDSCSKKKKAKKGANHKGK